jgi:hypothetical protein
MMIDDPMPPCKASSVTEVGVGCGVGSEGNDSGLTTVGDEASLCCSAFRCLELTRVLLVGTRTLKPQ